MPAAPRRLGGLALLLLVLAVAAPAEGAVPGALDPLGEPLECISESGTSGDCLDGRGLDGATALVHSGDGQHAYAASPGSGAVAVLTRDPATRALRQAASTAACVSDTGSGGACADGRALGGAAAVAISPDGATVYVASPGPSAIAAFRRDAVTGRLTQLAGTAGCIAETPVDGCLDGRALLGVTALAVSPDGKHVYAAALHSNAVAVLRRDPATGALTQAATTAGCIRNGGGSGCATGRALGQPAGLAANAAGTRVYAAAQASDAVLALTRDPATGALTQPSGTGPCVARTSVNGCAVGRGLDGVSAVAVAPDGSRVFAAAPLDDAVTGFSTSAGGVAQVAGAAGCRTRVERTGCKALPGLDGPRSVAVRADGQRLGIASREADSAHRIDVSTGSLEWGVACAAHLGVPVDCWDAAALDGAAGVAFAPDGTFGVAAAESDALWQDDVGDPIACIAAYEPTCTRHPDSGTEGNFQIVVPRDGRHAYQVAADCDRFPCNNPWDQLITYSRNTTTGVLTPVAGRSGGWAYAHSVVASPDSRFLYVLHGADFACGEEACPAGVTVLQRNTTTGALTVVSDVTPRTFLYGGTLGTSPDGKDLYVLGDGDQEPVLVHFRRNTTTGALTQPAGTAGCLNHSGADGCLPARIPRSGMSVTNTGVFLAGFYDRAPVFGDGVPMVAGLRRNTTTGNLTEVPGAGGCLTAPITDGCGAATGLGGSDSKAVKASADARHVYVSPGDSLGVAGFSWSSSAGLRQLTGAGACVVPRDRTGCGAAEARYGSGGSLEIAPDGRHVYLQTYHPGQISVFARNATTGVLTQLAGRDGCVSEDGANGCADGRLLGSGLLVTPDNRFVYTNGALFRRIL